MYSAISNPMEYKVGLYIRLSKEDDKERESESVTNQRSLLREFTEKHKLYVHDEYVDDGFSGTNFERPEFKRLIDDIESKRVNMVITKDMSRLGRDYIMTGYYMERYFPENRVRYISLLDGVDTGKNDIANDITPFRAIMNDMYAKDISKKITSVKRDKQRKGLFIGGKAPYGYAKSLTEKNKIVIDDIAADVVRRVFNWALQGKSCREIATILNDERIPTPSDYAGIDVSKRGIYTGMWSSERVTFMLRNEVYIGNMVQGRVKKVNYKSDKVLKIPEDEWIVVEGTHEPLIDKDTFDTVQRLLSTRVKTRTRTYDYLLKGLVYCGDCRYGMAVIKRKLAHDDEVLYFVCRTYQRFTKANKCTAHIVRVADVTNAVLDRVKQICMRYLDDDEMERQAKAALEHADADDKIARTINEITSKIELLTRNMDEVYADKLSGVLSSDDFARIYNKFKDERQFLQDKLDTLKHQRHNTADVAAKAKALARRFIDEVEVNRELICSLIDRIEITDDKDVVIHWAFSPLECLQ